MFAEIARGNYLEALYVDDEAVWYCDVGASGIAALSPDGHAGHWLPDRYLIGGLYRNHDGALLASGRNGIAWVDPATGATGMLIEAIDGVPVTGINEMCPDGDGGLYFGTTDLAAVEAGTPFGPSALYRLRADRRVTQVAGGLAFSNGIGLSPDCRTLYHNETFVGVFAYDLASGERRMLLEKPDCDGLAIDADGNIWVAGFQTPALLCLGPDGTIRDRLDLPGEGATNLFFAGDDGRDLFVNCVTTASVKLLAKGTMPVAGDSVLYRGRSSAIGWAISPTGFDLAC